MNVALSYAGRLVAGVFCGFLIYEYAGSETVPAVNGRWENHEDAPGTGKLIIAVTAGILIALSLAFNFLLWDGDWNSSDFVPDNGPMTLTFFSTVLATTLFARTALAPVKGALR